MFSHRYQQQHLHSSRVLYHHHHLASVWRGLFFPHGCTLIPCANVLPAHKTTQNRYHFVSFWCLLKLSLCVWIFFSLVFILLPVGWYCFRFIRVQYAEPLILVMGLKQMAFVTVGFALLANCLLLMWFFFSLLSVVQGKYSKSIQNDKCFIPVVPVRIILQERGWVVFAFSERKNQRVQIIRALWLKLSQSVCEWSNGRLKVLLWFGIRLARRIGQIIRECSSNRSATSSRCDNCFHFLSEFVFTFK